MSCQYSIKQSSGTAIEAEHDRADLKLVLKPEGRKSSAAVVRMKKGQDERRGQEIKVCDEPRST